MSGREGKEAVWREVIAGSGSERVRYTCVCAERSGRSLVLGTTTGKLHVYNSSSSDWSGPYKFHKMVSCAAQDASKLPEREDEAVAEVSYQGDIDACGVASTSGRVCAVHLGLRDPAEGQRRRQARHLLLEHEKHFGKTVTQLSWVKAQGALYLCTGDDEGKLCLVDVTSEIARAARNHHSLLPTKLETGLNQMLKREKAQGKREQTESREWTFDAPVVQIFAHPREGGVLVVSTRRASYILHVAKGECLQIGKKPRNGAYGCCVLADVPESDIFRSLRKNGSEGPKGGLGP